MGIGLLLIKILLIICVDRNVCNRTNVLFIGTPH